MVYTKICEGCSKKIYWDTQVNAFVNYNDNYSIHQCGYRPPLKKQHDWVVEELADFKLDVDKQLSSLGKSVAGIRVELHELNESLKVILRSVTV